jgi:hypothetical protein
MSAQRLTDAQIATAVRAHLPAHARADVRMRIAAEVSTSRQRQPLPSVFALLSDADPDARRRVMLLGAALLLAVGVVAAAAVGAFLRKDEPVRITSDPAVDAPAFVDEAFAAHRVLPPMTLVARLWDVDEGPLDVQRFYVDGTGRLRHECCGGTTIIIGGESAGSTNQDGSGNPIWLLGSAGAPDALPGFELAMYSGFGTPNCVQGWRYVGPDRVIDRPAHHLACPQQPQGDVELPDLELWLDAELGITLRSATWSIQMDENNEPFAPYGSEMAVESIVFGEPDPALFDPPPGLTAMTQEEYNCQFDPASCRTSAPPQTPLPATTAAPGPPENDPPDLAALVAATLQSYAGSPAMAVFVEERGNLDGEWRRFTDGTGRFREEWHFDPASPANPTVYLGTREGVFESWYQDDGTTEWRQMRSGGPALSPTFLTLGLPGTCAEGWTYHGLDLLLGAEAWHIACARDEYWIDRDRPLVLRHAIEPDALHTTGASWTVLHIEVGPQPDALFELPEDAIVTEGRG